MAKHKATETMYECESCQDVTRHIALTEGVSEGGWVCADYDETHRVVLI